MFTYEVDMRWTIDNEKKFVMPTPKYADVEKISATEKII
jgi:hypothetical protein